MIVTFDFSALQWVFKNWKIFKCDYLKTLFYVMCRYVRTATICLSESYFLPLMGATDYDWLTDCTLPVSRIKFVKSAFEPDISFDI
jgi:hypothetical protein